MNIKNIITFGVGLAVGAIIYNVVAKQDKTKDSNFSSACGCGA